MRKLACKVITVAQEMSKQTYPALMFHPFKKNNYTYHHNTWKPVGMLEVLWIPQHVNFVSSRQINPKDFFIYEAELHQCESLGLYGWPISTETGKAYDSDLCAKIEATTDSFLLLPLIPERFLKQYAEKQVTGVSLILKDYSDELELLQTTDKADARKWVSILEPQETFSREEVKDLLREFDSYASEQIGRAIPDGGSWFDENY